MIFHNRQPDYLTKSFEYLKYLTDKGKKFELKEIRKNRSLPQKGYMYIAFKQVQIDTGNDIEEIKQTLFKTICNPDIFIIEGEYGKYLRSTESLDTKEMSVAIDNFRNYCSAELGIYIPGPNETEKIEMWQAELSRYE